MLGKSWKIMILHGIFMAKTQYEIIIAISQNIMCMFPKTYIFHCNWEMMRMKRFFIDIFFTFNCCKVVSLILNRPITPPKTPPIGPITALITLFITTAYAHMAYVAYYMCLPYFVSYGTGLLWMWVFGSGCEFLVVDVTFLVVDVTFLVVDVTVADVTFSHICEYCD